MITEQTRVKLNEIIDRGLCCGIGDDPAGSVCIEQAISIAIGEEPKDTPTCVHPVVRAHSVRLNDARWSSQKVRADSMRAYALNQLGCRAIDGQRFAEIVALRTVTELLPIVLRSAGLEEHAKSCEAAKNLPAAAAAARYAAAAAAAARYAARYADAAAAARYADDAADAAARYADDAARYADAAADAAAARYAAAAAAAAAADARYADADAAAARYAAAAAAAAADARYADAAADAILILATKIANEALEQCLAEAA